MDPCHFGIGNGGYDCTAGYFGAIQLPVLPYPRHYKRAAIRAHDAVGHRLLTCNALPFIKPVCGD